ncbi:zf-HC2 domain-containing protein [Herbiconiux solani]|uniref:zf-HC2 domain-containing protein n=1 Tax=Herbiconiux solani TaxID=661329 RepID=UPI000824DA33|nr:zf-HC2 domain-containing protein [Herbiconiux solani]
MTDCGCDKARAELEEYFRNEICRTDAAEIRAHLETCEGCQSELHIGIVLTQTVQRACKETAPDELRDQLLARLRAVQLN